MPAEPTPATAPPPIPVTLTTDGHHATLVFNGALDAHMVRQLEEQLADPRLRQSRTWELKMSGLSRLDLTCAYALLRAATTMPEPVELHIEGVRRTLQRTLREVGIDAVATIED
ncbi:STAS domain-containing protein [Streptomyces sp. NPDC000070]|uniref:STAS domain-containing protein n=1 Tax=Streptomyces sp. NPDC000070 TaxID=3154240 RepID=UPI00332A158D